MKRLIPVIVLAALLSTQVIAQGDSKRTLTPADYAGWEQLLGARISDDGHWLAYGIAPVDGDARMTIRNCDSRERWDTKGGTSPRFSPDSRWCAYIIRPPRQAVEELRAAGKPIEPRLGLRDLTTGAERVFDRVSGFEILKSGPTLVIQHFRGAGRTQGGADLTLVTPSTGQELTIGNVAQARPNASEDLLILAINSDSGEQGVQLLDTANFSLKTLAWGQDDVEGLDWAEGSDTASFLLGKRDPAKNGAYYRVVIATNLRAPKVAQSVFDPSKRSDFPSGQRIVPFYGTNLNRAGSVVAFGVQPWEDAPKGAPSKELSSNVIVWNTRDVDPVPSQVVRSEAIREHSDVWLWNPQSDGLKSLSLGSDKFGVPLGDFSRDLVIDETPYRTSVTNGFRYVDVDLVDPWKGSSQVVLKKSHWAGSIVPSPSGRYIAYYSDRHWWLLDTATGKSWNATATTGTTFENSLDDHLTPEKPYTEAPVWFRNDSGVLFFDQYDAFIVHPDRPGVLKLTDGRKAKQEYRFVDATQDALGPRIEDPIYLGMLDTESKAQGLYACDQSGAGKQLIFQNLEIGAFHKAANADRVMFIMESFEHSPNVYITNQAFTAIKPETHTNPQQDSFLWGHTQLVNYKSRWGAPLSGVLIYPADYHPDRKYPMVTYIYERLSDELHQYEVPDPMNPYNVQILSQNGYFVFKPDIAYRDRRTPGEDAVNCLEPALKAVFDLKVGVDPAHVGLMGHSWGGYQTAFVTTVSKMFAVGVAGAPLTELTSMYNSYYRVSGAPDQESFETGQGRMGVPFWEDPKDYIDNSPVWRSRERTTPLLFAAGDRDRAVDFTQSLYLYNTLRRLGNDAVLLEYPGEDHSLASRPVREDYARRVREYLDVYLKGAKPEPWITVGVPLVGGTRQSP